MDKKLDSPRTSRGGSARRTAVSAAIVVAVLLGGLIGGGSVVRADVYSNVAIATAVAPGGTLTTTVTTPGVTIISSELLTGCPATALPAASVTYTCNGNSSGIAANVAIEQGYSFSTGSIAVTVTYNANGPVTGFPAVTHSTQDSGSCSANGAKTFICTGTASVATGPGGILALNVDAHGDQFTQISAASDTVGTCPATNASSPAGAKPDNKEVFFACGAGQSVRAGASIFVVLKTAVGATVPTMQTYSNNNAPVPATNAIPAPTFDTRTVGGLDPTLSSISPLTGPAGTVVTLSGAYFSGATAVSFGTTAATLFSCATDTSCTATAPSLSPGTVANVTVTGAFAGPSNGIPFTFVAAPLAAAAAPNLASISPSSGPGGANVTLAGANLTGATGVNFGTTAATAFSCATATSCTATAPSLSAGTAVNVTVTTAGASSNPLTFTFVPATTAAASSSAGSTASAVPATSAASTGATTGSTAPATSVASSGAVAAAATAGIAVSYAAGWNIAGGPTASVITGADGPLYAYPAGSSAYQVTAAGAPLQAGQGYWAYFDSAATVTIPIAGPQSINVVLPAGQWMLVGNPGNTAAGISGADVVYVYSVAAGYQTTPTLGPGQGAWVFSNAGGTVTISNR